MVNTYLELVGRLKTFLNVDYAYQFPVENGQEPVSRGLQWIDLYMGQPEALKLRENHNKYPIPLPAVFIQMDIPEWVTKANNLQEGLMNVSFHIVQETLGDTYFNANQNIASTNQTEALNLMLFKSQVYRTLQGFRGTEMTTSLKRVSSQLDFSSNNVHIDIETYQCEVLDTAARSYQDWTEFIAGLRVTHNPNLI